MTIFYDQNGLIISDTGLVFEGRKIDQTKIDSWRLRWIDKSSRQDLERDVYIWVHLKTIIPAFIATPPSFKILLTTEFIVNNDFNGCLKVRAFRRTEWPKYGDVQGYEDSMADPTPEQFQSDVNQFKSITRALDMMLASK